MAKNDLAPGLRAEMVPAGPDEYPIPDQSHDFAAGVPRLPVVDMRSFVGESRRKRKRGLISDAQFSPGSWRVASPQSGDMSPQSKNGGVQPGS